jgi:predicted HTH domain antitoxin
MAWLAVEVPEEMVGPISDPVAELRLAAAIHWYQQGRISQERAAEFAGLDRTDFLLELGRRGGEVFEVFGVDFEDLERELARD